MKISAAIPRDLDRDLALLRDEGVAAVFTPSPEEMYLPGADTIVDVPSLSGILQGALRPGHFQGVATVVSKLFNITQPDVAVFGEKDYQQLALIRKMVRDLDVPVRIIGHPTAREDDGLAMSSRNVRLSPAQRAAAKILNACIDPGRSTIPSPVRKPMWRRLPNISRARRYVISNQLRSETAKISLRSQAHCIALP
jgi:pantoate--beta-alanine ligase